MLRDKMSPEVRSVIKQSSFPIYVQNGRSTSDDQMRENKELRLPKELQDELRIPVSEA